MGWGRGLRRGGRTRARVKASGSSMTQGQNRDSEHPTHRDPSTLLQRPRDTCGHGNRPTYVPRRPTGGVTCPPRYLRPTSTGELPPQHSGPDPWDRVRNWWGSESEGKTGSRPDFRTSPSVAPSSLRGRSDGRDLTAARPPTTPTVPATGVSHVSVKGDVFSRHSCGRVHGSPAAPSPTRPCCGGRSTFQDLPVQGQDRHPERSVGGGG